MDSRESQGDGAIFMVSKLGTLCGFVACCEAANEIYFECTIKVESLNCVRVSGFSMRIFRVIGPVGFLLGKKFSHVKILACRF